MFVSFWTHGLLIKFFSLVLFLSANILLGWGDDINFSTELGAPNEEKKDEPYDYDDTRQELEKMQNALGESFDPATHKPERVVRCYGLVPSSQASNHLLLRGRNHRCDGHGFIMLLDEDCVRTRRGYKGLTMPLFGCAGGACEEDLDNEQCDVDKVRLKEGFERITNASVLKKTKRDNMVFKGRAFERSQPLKTPILTSY